MSETSVLRVRSLTVRSREPNPAILIDHVDLDLRRGERLGIVGPSGSGKSTLLKAIAGFTPARLAVEGTVLLDIGTGQPPSNLLSESSTDRLRLVTTQMALMWQDSMRSLNPFQRIGTQIRRTLTLHEPHLSVRELDQMSVRWLERVGLDDAEELLRHYPHELSGGMRQRIVLVLSLCGRQPIVVADEPTTALDMVHQAECLDLLRTLCVESHRALLYVSHDLALVSRMCNRVLVLGGGAVVDSGSCEQVFANPSSDVTAMLVNRTRRVRPR